MPIYAIPHTPEWFTALEAVNPFQAGLTRGVLASVGRDDVCSICGDYPAQDYHLTGQKLAPNAVATLRLCDDCREFRKGMHNEVYVLLSE